MTYSDAQLVLLSSASQRDDGLLPCPAKLAGAVLRSFEASLIKAGVAEPIAVRRDQPAWRQDEAETPVGLRITAVGLAALGIQPTEPIDKAEPTTTRAEHEPSDAAPPVRPAATPLRTGTKRALLVELLSGAEGAHMELLVASLGWQPHTVRAALTRLRQDGFIIVASKDAQKQAVYHIGGSATEGTSTEVVA